MTPDAGHEVLERPAPLDAARARARANERTRELPIDRRARRPSLNVILAVLVAVALGFGLGLAASGDDPQTSATVEAPQPPSVFNRVDPSTVPAPTGPTRTVTAGETP